jgi:hypothetical protein
MRNPPVKDERLSRIGGAVAQAVVIGILLFVSTFELFTLASDAELFRYQGF